MQQQQALQRQLLTQQLLLQQQAAAATPILVLSAVPVAAVPTAAATKKAREIYIGNLAIGQVTSDMLRELFNTVLANFIADPVNNPPVIEVKMDPSGLGEHHGEAETCMLHVQRCTN